MTRSLHDSGTDNWENTWWAKNIKLFLRKSEKDESWDNVRGFCWIEVYIHSFD